MDVVIVDGETTRSPRSGLYVTDYINLCSTEGSCVEKYLVDHNIRCSFKAHSDRPCSECSGTGHSSSNCDNCKGSRIH